MSTRIARYAAVLGQLGLLVFGMRLLSIEEDLGLLAIAPLVLAGFAVHAWLPKPLRLPFFALLFPLGAGLVLGILPAAILTGLLLGILGICHLPLPWAARVGLLLFVGGTLAAVRAEWIPVDGAGEVLPVLAAVLMFRLAVYMYDLKNEKGPVSPWHRLAYFFMPENVCFVLHPVVDFKTFVRVTRDDDDFLVRQKGVEWILLGIVHLVLYRVVYHYLTVSPVEVEDVTGVALFAVSSYLVYLRISGMFHMTAGMLCLFGFDLPLTNNWYLFASSLTDYWRRINIYWTEFLKKLVYFPIVMRLRKRGTALAMLVATAAAFAVSWLLHAYQWFWLRGTFPLTAVDGIFWGSVGALVVLDTVWELRRAAGRAPAASAGPLGQAFGTALRTAGVFCLMCLLWSVWSSADVPAWWSVMSQASTGLATGLPAIVGALALAVAVQGTFLYLKATGRIRFPAWGFGARAAAVGALGLALAGAGLAASEMKREEGASDLWTTLTENRLNAADAERRIRGYYEGLLSLGAGEGQDGERKVIAGDWGELGGSNAVKATSDMRLFELLPLVSIRIKGETLTTNRFGMRDKEYTEKKPAGTFRIAVLGASPTMGSGVGDGQAFEALLEKRLNAHPKGAGPRHYEVLNFAVGGYGLLQQVAVCKTKVFGFDPDAVFYVAHRMRGVEYERFHALSEKGIPLPPALARIRDGLILIPLDDDLARRKYFKRAWNDVLTWGYARIGDMIRRHGAVPVWIDIPLPKELTQSGDPKPQDTVEAKAARSAGFDTIAIEGIYKGIDPGDLVVSDFDDHPNAKGHRLIAEGIYEALMRDPRILDGKGN